MGTGSKDLSVETIDGKLTVGTKRRVDADELTSSEATGIYWLVNFLSFLSEKKVDFLHAVDVVEGDIIESFTSDIEVCPLFTCMLTVFII